MDIKFEGLDESIKISEYAIREVTESCSHSESPPTKRTRFQALISGKKLSKHSTINCLFKYYGENNQFLGLDTENIWIQEKQPIALSMAITIPDDTVKSEVQFKLRKDFGVYFAWLWGIGIFFIISLGINTLFDFFH